MEQKNTKLLFKELSNRLPYGVKCWVDIKHLPEHERKDPYQGAHTLLNVSSDGSVEFEKIDYSWSVEYVRPYLRPMSSMTEEEIVIFNSDFGYPADDDWYNSMEIKRIDWLNANHFDYRHLIESGLALKAPKGMYNKTE